MVDIRVWYKYSYIFFTLSLILLVGVEILGSGYGAKRWIRLFGFGIQPSELVKVTLILVLARYYHDLRYDRIILIRNLILPAIFIFIP